MMMSKFIRMKQLLILKKSRMAVKRFNGIKPHLPSLQMRGILPLHSAMVCHHHHCLVLDYSKTLPLLTFRIFLKSTSYRQNKKVLKKCLIRKKKRSNRILYVQRLINFQKITLRFLLEKKLQRCRYNNNQLKKMFKIRKQRKCYRKQCARMFVKSLLR